MALSVGDATVVPPVAAVYQITPVVDASVLFAFKVWIGLVSHCVMLPELAGAGGAGVMVSVTGVLLILEQLPLKYAA